MAARTKSLLALSALLALAACGGGGGDPGTRPTPPAPAPAPIGSDVNGRDFRVNSTTPGRQTLGRGAVARLAGGGHVVVWTSELAGGASVRLQRFDADSQPQGLEVLVAVTGEAPAVAPLADGGFVVTWNATPGSGGPGLMQRYGALGQPVGPALRFSTVDDQFLLESRPVLLANGRLLLVWTFTTAQSTGTQAAMRIFNADGTAATAELPLPAQLSSLDAAALPDGGFVIAWADGEVPDSQDSVRTRVFNADASLRRADLAVPSVAGADARDPAVTALADGRFVLAWERISDVTASQVEAQLYTASGAAVSAPLLAGEAGTFFAHPAIAALPDGGFALAWHQVHERVANYRRDTLAQRFDASAGRRGSVLRIGSAQVSGTAALDDDLRFNDRLAVAPTTGDGFLLVLQQPDVGEQRDWDVLGALR